MSSENCIFLAVVLLGIVLMTPFLAYVFSFFLHVGKHEAERFIKRLKDKRDGQQERGSN